MPDDPVKTIRIDAYLYERLRGFCDRQSIRFGGFVESALENTFIFLEAFMHTLIVVIIASVLLAASGCSSVPGDAALRSGHPEQAADLYRQGAEQGDASAALRLGLLIDEGRVSASKYGEAGDWFKRGCDLGNLPACHNVGVSYEYGKNGLHRDYTMAHHFYLKAAVEGYMQSQYNLASLYSNNFVTPPNEVEGLKWILLAQMSAFKCKQQSLCQWVIEDPPGHKQRLESRLSTAQQQAARNLAAEWVVKK
jgi:TPR repeat protein